MMSEWKKYKLDDLIEVKHGFAFKGTFITDTPTKDILVTPGNFKIGGGFKDLKFKYYTGECPESYTLKTGDIVVTMTDLSQDTDTLGYSAKIPERRGVKFLHNQRIGLVDIKSDEVIKDFLYWVLRTYEYQGFIKNSASGTSIMHTSPKNIKEYEFLLPPLPEQAAIAEVLSSLDDKIDLLHRQNSTIEKLASMLFRQWFIEEENGWEVGTLSDEFDFTMGQSPSGNTLNETGEGIIFYQGNSDFGFRFPKPRIHTTAPNRLAKKFDTLISVRAPVGDMNMALEECCLGRGVAAFRYKHNPAFHTYTYYKLNSLVAQIKQFEDNGTVFGSIGKDDFKRMESVIPPKKLIEYFQEEVGPMDEKIHKNNTQLESLQKLRNILLPKLMNGTIKVF